MLKFSVVIPICNEEQSVAPLYSSLRSIMEKMGQPYEIIFVDDCSVDNSLEIIKNIELKPANLIIVSLSKRSGQSLAMQAGFDIAQGELIITMDGDLQNDPEDIPGLLDKMNEGYDVFCGRRSSRKDPLTKLLVSRAACSVFRIITNINIHDFGCTLRIFKKEALRGVYLSAVMHMFFILIMAKLGRKIGEINVKHHPRIFGRSKYNTHNRLFEFLMGLMRVSFFEIPGLMEHKSDYQIKDVIRR